MYELEVIVKKVLGACSADPPTKKGDSFTVRDGDLRIPEGGSICLWALQSMLPVITPKEREIHEAKEDDWMWRVQHVQCPDPDGRVIFKIERKRKIEPGEQRGEDAKAPSTAPPIACEGSMGKHEGIRNLKVVVEETRGKCTSNMKPGDYFVLRNGRIHIPAGGHFCLYALHATLPLLPAKQRPMQDADWLKEAHHVICPDPAGNVVMRIEPEP
jgi:uncharacterized repeat protein (TIGR04076 family)